MSSLLKAQQEFASKVPLLLLQATNLGYQYTLGDAYRDPRCPYGSKSSKHKRRLAIDINLFEDGEYITNDKGHKELGAFWEGIGGIWGGRFNDPNHYEWRD